MASFTPSDRGLANAPNYRHKYRLRSISILIIVISVVYAAMFQNYKANLQIDTPWYLSYSYNYCIKGISNDVSFGSSFLFGVANGTVVSGKLAAMLQCAVLAPFNWSLVAANALSIAGVLLSMTAIFAFLVGEGFGRLVATICCLGLAVTDPFISMANQSRYDYVVFLLAVCGLLLAARRHLFLAGFISVLAIEVHPIGIMAPIYLISYELSRTVQTRRFRLELDRITKLALGGVLGVGVYIALHWHAILALPAAMASHPAELSNGAGHFLYGYFFLGRLYRHLPELAVFVVCLFVHVWRRQYREWPFPLIATFATFCAGFLIPHGNYFYTPFWYFPAFLLVFVTISARWDAIWVPVFVLILFLPQYAVAYVEGHKYARQDELEVARSVIASRGTDLSRAVIFGDSIFWPVFKDLSFKWTPALFNPQDIPARGPIYLICGLDPPFYSFEHVCADELLAVSNMQQIARFSWAGRNYLVYERHE